MILELRDEQLVAVLLRDQVELDDGLDQVYRLVAIRRVVGPLQGVLEFDHYVV